jgi:hypothetical protein
MLSLHLPTLFLLTFSVCLFSSLEVILNKGMENWMPNQKFRNPFLMVAVMFAGKALFARTINGRSKREKGELLL